MTFEELASNASVLIVAGSETSATLLSAAIFFLTRSPKALALLTDEVRHAFSRKDDIGLINTQGLSYMQAVLEEALRMYPHVAGGGSARLVAKGGVQIADYFIPENVCFTSRFPSQIKRAQPKRHAHTNLVVLEDRHWSRMICGRCTITRSTLPGQMISYRSDGWVTKLSKMIDLILSSHFL